MGLRPHAFATTLALLALASAACSHPSPADADDGLPLRFVSYNIRHCEGFDHVLDLGAIQGAEAAR